MFLPDFMLDKMPDTIVAIPGGEADMGGWVPSISSPPINVQCFISSKERRFTIKGEVVTSNARAITAKANNLSVKGWRFRLPNDGRFDPHGNSPQDPIEAIFVAKASDGEGPSHEIIFLP